MQRRKGAQGERNIVNLLKANGLTAKRISMMETGGIDKGDIEVNFTGILQKAQVKVGKQIPKFIYDALADYPFLFMKGDRKRWIVTMPLEQLILLLTIQE